MNARARRLSVLRPCSLVLLLAVLAGACVDAAGVTLSPPRSEQGYVARLLINEVPFPGERGWESEEDSKDAMRQILLVLDARLHQIPHGYTQRQIAMVQTDDMITLMTAEEGQDQIEGFYRNSAGYPATTRRVQSRIDYLMNIANEGPPGTFARLLSHAQSLATAYFARQRTAPDFFISLDYIGHIPVTGRAYSWMTDVGQFHPGGRYVKIPDHVYGSLGGNRFFTLKDLTR